MKNMRIKNTADAWVETKTELLTTTIKHAVLDIEDFLKVVREEAFGEGKPRAAANTLQLLAEAAERYAVTARMHDAQLVTLLCMQEVVDSEEGGGLDNDERRKTGA